MFETGNRARVLTGTGKGKIVVVVELHKRYSPPGPGMGKDIPHGVVVKYPGNKSRYTYHGHDLEKII